MLLIWSTLCGGEDLPRAGKGGARPVAVTLDRIGYPNGLLFESVEERQSVHFPLPRDIRKVSASLRLQLIWSPLWLSRFSMGPFEWVWRRLSYGKPLSMAR